MNTQELSGNVERAQLRDKQDVFIVQTHCPVQVYT